MFTVACERVNVGSNGSIGRQLSYKLGKSGHKLVSFPVPHLELCEGESVAPFA